MLYILIREDYSAKKLNGVKQVLHACNGYRFQDGRIPICSNMMKLYKYTEDQIEIAKKLGGVRGVDWSFLIQKI